MKRSSDRGARSKEQGRGGGLAPSLAARVGRLLEGLHALYPEAQCELRHESAFGLLIATILSAQSTDSNVNRVMPALLARYPDPRSLADADPAEVESLVHSTGFFRAKTRNIMATARKLLAEYSGRVPDRMEALLTLPGVARKTANVVLGTWFRKAEGIVVDTHVGRLAHRLGLTRTSRGPKHAVAIERDLQALVPSEEWIFLGHALTLHGRRVCGARRPRCADCVLRRDCPSALAGGGA